MARQNLMIVVPEVGARSAYSEMVHRAALPGSLTASLATRCSAGARLGISARMRTTTSTGASGSDTGLPWRADPEPGRRAVADRLAAIAAPPSNHFLLAAPDFPTLACGRYCHGQSPWQPEQRLCRVAGRRGKPSTVPLQVPSTMPYRFATGFPRPIGRWPLCVTRRSAYSDHVNNRLQEAQGAP